MRKFLRAPTSLVKLTTTNSVRFRKDVGVLVVEENADSLKEWICDYTDPRQLRKFKRLREFSPLQVEDIVFETTKYEDGLPAWKDDGMSRESETQG